MSTYFTCVSVVQIFSAFKIQNFKLPEKMKNRKKCKVKMTTVMASTTALFVFLLICVAGVIKYLKLV